MFKRINEILNSNFLKDKNTEEYSLEILTNNFKKNLIIHIPNENQISVWEVKDNGKLRFFQHCPIIYAPTKMINFIKI